LREAVDLHDDAVDFICQRCRAASSNHHETHDVVEVAERYANLADDRKKRKASRMVIATLTP